MKTQKEDKPISLAMFDPDEIQHMAIVLKFFDLDRLPPNTPTELLQKIKTEHPHLFDNLAELNHFFVSKLDAEALEYARKHQFPSSILHGLLQIQYLETE